MAITLRELWAEYRDRPFEGDHRMLDMLDNIGEAIFVAGASAAFRHLETGGSVRSLQRELQQWITELEQTARPH